MKGEKQNMNKLFTKLAKLFLGISMAAGVGVAITTNNASSQTSAANDVTVTYTIQSKTSASKTSGTQPTGATVSYSQTYSTAKQATNGNSMTMTISGYDGCTITGLSVSVHSNAKQGKGSLSFKSGDTTIGSIAEATFNDSSWHGSYTSSYVDVSVTCTSTTVGTGEDLVIYIECPSGKSNNSMYFESATITYNEPAIGPTKLSTPTGVTYDSTNQQVKWNSVSNASGYKFSSDNGASYSSTTTNLYYDVSSLTNGQTYTCKVYAVGDGSSYSDSDAASYEFTKTAPASYTGVTVEGGELDGTEKGSAFIECSASATGTNLPNPITFTWSVTESNSYGTTTSLTNKATIDSNGKVTFLDNCTVYVWALAPDGSTHNSSGYAAIASGLIDPKGSQTNPYTVTEAWNIIDGYTDNGNSATVVYVTGVVSGTPSDNQYGSTFVITDGSKSITAYSINGAQSSNSSAAGYVNDGYTVVVGGALIKFYKNSTYTYEVGYKSGFNSSLVSSIAPKSISSIAVKTSPTKTTYDAGEYFAPAGLVITVTYSDTTTEDVAYSGNESKFTFTPTTSTALTTSNVSVTIGYGGQSTSQAITVNAVPAVISVTVSPSSASVNIGATTSLSATVEVEGGAAQTVSWSTSDGSVATVANGVVTGVAAGTATITATSTVNNEKSGSATITVVDPTDTKVGTYALVKDVSLLGDGDWIVITNIAGTYGMGEQGSNSYRSQVAVTLTGSDIVISNTLNTSLKAAKLSVKNSHFEIKTDEGYLYANSGSSNNVGSRATNSDANGEWVFTINSSSGDATCIAQGSNSRKSLRYNNNSGQQRFSCYAESNSMQDIHIYKKLPGTAAVSLTSNKEVLTSIGDTATLTAKAYSDSGKTKEIAGLTNTDFEFTSGDTNILTVSESGVVTAVASGETTITVSRDEYEDSVTIKVVYVTIDSINSGTSVEAGDEGTFTFTWSSNSLKPDTYDVEWSSNNNNAFVVNNDGSYLAGDAGETATITVTITDEDLNEYVATKVFSTVSTVVAATHISVTESSGVTAYVGSNVSLHISVLGDGDVPATNQNVTCTSLNTDILTVNNSGVITPKARGTATITVVDQEALCEPVVINVRVRNTVYGSYKEIGEFDFSGYTSSNALSTYYTAKNSYSEPTAISTTKSEAQSTEGVSYLKLASGSASGSLTVTFEDTIEIKKVVINAKVWSGKTDGTSISGASKVGSYSDAAFADATFTFEDEVSTFTLTVSSGKQLYVHSVKIYADRDNISSEANTQACYSFEESCMKMEQYINDDSYNDSRCTSNYSAAKSAFNNLSEEQRTLFLENEAFADSAERLLNWAAAKGDSLTNENSLDVSSRFLPLLNLTGNGNSVAIIVIISIVSMTSIGAFFFIRKRKENI